MIAPRLPGVLAAVIAAVLGISAAYAMGLFPGLAIGVFLALTLLATLVVLATRGILNTLEVSWVLLWFGFMSFSQKTAEESLAAQLDPQNLARVCFDVLAIALLLPHVRRVSFGTNRALTVFALYVLVGLASVLWSTSPLASLVKVAEIAVGLLIVVVSAGYSDQMRRLRRLMNIYLGLAAALLCLVLLGYLAVPSAFSIPATGVISRSMSWSVISANGVANTGAALGLVSLARFLFRGGSAWRKFYLAAWLMSFLFPVLAQGRAGLTMLLVGSLLLVSLRHAVWGIVATAGVAFVALGLVSSRLWEFFVRGQSSIMLTSISGRTTLWERAWVHFLESPILGKGFGVGSRTILAVDTQGYDDAISSVHNGFFEVVLGVGLLGLLFWLASIVWSVSVAIRAGRRRQCVDCVILFIPFLATTFVSTGVGGWMSTTVGLFFVSTALVWLSSESRLPGRIESGIRSRTVRRQTVGVATCCPVDITVGPSWKSASRTSSRWPRIRSESELVTVRLRALQGVMAWSDSDRTRSQRVLP